MFANENYIKLCEIIFTSPNYIFILFNIDSLLFCYFKIIDKILADILWNNSYFI